MAKFFFATSYFAMFEGRCYVFNAIFWSCCIKGRMVLTKIQGWGALPLPLMVIPQTGIQAEPTGPLMVRKMEDRASARVLNAGSKVGPTNSWSTNGGGGSVYGWDHSCPHWSTAGSDHSWSTVGRGHCSSHGHTSLPLLSLQQ